MNIFIRLSNEKKIFYQINNMENAEQNNQTPVGKWTEIEFWCTIWYKVIDLWNNHPFLSNKDNNYENGRDSGKQLEQKYNKMT